MISIAIHGGAGVIRRSSMDGPTENLHHQGLKEALEKGFQILNEGGSSLDAVVSAIVTLEDNILFNAGRGSVFTKEGRHEMDAALMWGKSLECGAVTGVREIRNPILLAREVMLHSGHVFLSGRGAEDFARKRGLKTESEAYFYSSHRHDQWKKVSGSNRYIMDHGEDPGGEGGKFGTVGAVALDREGNISAATSTGGMTNKAWGRIGDSPVIGSGTYANNNTCGISCTGHGEIFIRSVAAYDVSCLMEYGGLTLQDAMKKVVLEKLPIRGGEGGMIGVDSKGKISMIFNCDGMYRGMKDSEGNFSTAIYK